MIMCQASSSPGRTSSARGRNLGYVETLTTRATPAPTVGVMSSGPHLIENPLSGERILIRRTAAETGGALLEWELFLAPGGRVPSSHAHPEQEERFTVLAGSMRFRVGRRSLTARAGETVRIPPGTVHHFENAGEVRAHLMVQTRPALDMETLLRTAAALARQQLADSRALPHPVDLALFMRDFEREVRAPYLPAAVVRAVVSPLAWLAARCSLDTRYQQLRTPAPPDNLHDRPSQP
jgi:quercetin dioxygenase-like cupin family protein